MHPNEMAREPMPNISPGGRGPATAMPTVGRTGITHVRNDEYSFYDETRLLLYYWRSKPGSQAPDSLVTVLTKTNTFYTFRRAKPKPTAAPRPARHK
ncbi:hypothetical protein JAO73_22495 [Hymenobacter sp. BT523]|uniref:hypothetical protein n=1 Tax=Hymenobacter sp. BT523 TaxID=2795725 RepID=UPI0018ECB1FE|nr:hypothetical protein [Hymenobacter sp. BT523]MBJ6111807.1 hypothetical protein [Hymenobacter sp. BT523]